MKRLLLSFSLFLCMLLVSCKKNNGESKSNKPAQLAVEVPAVHYPLETLFSPDPEVSGPALEWAIENHEGDRIFATWLVSRNKNARTRALKHLMSSETESPAQFYGILNEITQEANERREEVKKVAEQIGK